VRDARVRCVLFVAGAETPGSPLFVGRVPDGVERIRVAVEGEQPRSGPVDGNSFETEVSGPGRASFTGPNGSHRFPFGAFPE